MNVFAQGANWEAASVSDAKRSQHRAWTITYMLGACLITMSIALAALFPLRRTIPYVVRQDSQTGNVEVLQAFDNRTIGTQELLNKHWAVKYVTAREQYNWWLVATDYDVVAALTDPAIFRDYSEQFVGDRGLDKVFGDFTDRRIKILSVAPSPTNPQQMVVRFERTTTSRGAMVETPTIFAANMAFRYQPKTYASEAEMIRNPTGYQVFSYRRDAEGPASTPPAAGSPVEAPAQPAPDASATSAGG